MRKLCLLLVVLLCLNLSAVAEYTIPDRLGFVGVIERMGEAGDRFWMTQPGDYVYEVQVTEKTVLATEDALHVGMIVDVLLDAPEKVATIGDHPVRAARIQDAMYDMYVWVTEGAGDNPAGAGGIVSGNPRVLFPAGTDVKAIEDKQIRFRPYVVEGTSPHELVEAREFTEINIVGGDVLSVDGDSILIAPYNAEEESIRVRITDHTTQVHALAPGMSVEVVYSVMDYAMSPPEIAALTIWPSFG